MADCQQIRRKRCGGVLAASVDGRTWTWTVGSQMYRWCLLGHVEIVSGRRVARIAYFRQLTEAIAYTIGYHDCAADARSGRASYRYQTEKPL